MEAFKIKLLKYCLLLSKKHSGVRSTAIGVSEATVNHSENGSKDLTPCLILKLLNGYGHSLEELGALLYGNIELSENTLSEGENDASEFSKDDFSWRR